MGKLTATQTIFVLEKSTEKNAIAGGFAMLFTTTATTFQTYFTTLSDAKSDNGNQKQDLAIQMAKAKLVTKLLNLYKHSGVSNSKDGESPYILFSEPITKIIRQ